MGNVDRANGFKPVQKLDGSPWNGKLREYAVASNYATNIFVGSPVKLAGSASADGTKPTVALCGVTDVPVGIVVGIKPTVDNMNPKYAAASTGWTVLVCDDPNVIMEIQADEDIEVGDIGSNATFTAESGNTSTGFSTCELDSSTIATTITLPLKLIGLVPAVDNEVGTNSKALVMWNIHQFCYWNLIKQSEVISNGC
jgi:hypothetical protein